METTWLIGGGNVPEKTIPEPCGVPEPCNESLVVFVLGWASDPRCVEHIRPAGCDVVCVYDFRNMKEHPKIPFEKYRRRYLFAWSFGVWAAEQFFAGVEWTRAVAFCGSPLPVDATYGIEPKRLMITLKGIRRNGIGEFNRRMFGVDYARFEPMLPFRDQFANEEELLKLYEESCEPYTPALKWDKGVVGEQDVIFPPENLIAYWGERAEVLPLPHYPFGDPQLIIREIGK